MYTLKHESVAQLAERAHAEMVMEGVPADQARALILRELQHLLVKVCEDRQRHRALIRVKRDGCSWTDALKAEGANG